MCNLQETLDAIIDITDVNDRGICVDHVATTCKGAGSHIVFQNLDGIHITEVHTGNFVKGNAIPVTHQTYTMSAQIIEEVGSGGLSTAHQNGIGRNFLVDMRFTGAARPQFTEIEVVLHQR